MDAKTHAQTTRIKTYNRDGVFLRFKDIHTYNRDGVFLRFVCLCVRACMRACVCVRVCTCVSAHILHANMRVCCVRTHIHMQTIHIHTCTTHAHTHTRRHTCTHTHAHKHTPTPTHIHAHTHTHARTNARTHKRTHALVHTHNTRMQQDETSNPNKSAADGSRKFLQVTRRTLHRAIYLSCAASGTLLLRQG